MTRTLSVLLLGVASMALSCGDDDDACERARKKYAAYVESHQQCQVDGDCVVVGGCSNTLGFASVRVDSRQEAQRLSEAPSPLCSQYDGPTFGAVCQAGQCQTVSSGLYCGMPTLRLDASLDAASDGAADPARVDAAP